MVSKNELKQLAQLGQKKFREQRALFPVEGKKAITTFHQNGFEMKYCFSLETAQIGGVDATKINVSDMKKLSNLTTPPNIWAAFSIPKPTHFAPQNINIALDGIRNPGNLGTIIRLCDWFGIAHLLCSLDTVDCFNPKVVQASMGSLAHVQLHYVDLLDAFNTYELLPVGTDTNGENIYNATVPQNGVLVMGNEGQGISDRITAEIKENISIPAFGTPAAESLNVAVATGIILAEFSRRD
jgi:TrmH family RNA methyltransferase